VTSLSAHAAKGGVESTYAWIRLTIALALGTVGSVGMWSFVVALPAVQAEFGVARGDASLPFTLTMIGFGGGGVLMGRLADRHGVVIPAIAGAVLVGTGYVLSGFATSIWQFALAQGLIGLGTSATFGPLMTDISHWFTRRRGIAVALASSGNYLAGTVWPPIIQALVASIGWRHTQIGIGLFCVATMLPLALAFRRRPPKETMAEAAAAAAIASARGAPNMSPNMLQALLIVAGVACCVAMSMPQVHIVAYCSDLGYGVARGAEMLSVMLGFGIFSRIGCGLIADRIGGLRTLLLSSVLQGVALVLYLMFDGLASLYVISALFGLFQGGLVPMYAIIVRECFAPQEAGMRLGIVLLATLVGMALGGWMSGAIFDLTGSYQAAFANGVLWNLVNVAIVVWLISQSRPRVAHA
jgi:MFS family permease